jgi:prenyltransferase beta subunit
MIWAISVVLALAGLVFLALAAMRLLRGMNELNLNLDRVQERVGQVQDLQERLNSTLAEAERASAALPKK